MFEPVCLFCGNNDNIIELYDSNIDLSNVEPKYITARSGNIKRYRTVKCKKCNLIFSNPVLEEEKLLNLYSKTETVNEKENKNAAISYYHDISEKLPDKKSSILEIGCGEGYFLEQLYVNGYKNFYGLEPAGKLNNNVDKEVENRILELTLTEDINLPEKKFDMLCAFMVLEHLSNPEKFLELCYKFLKPGGVLVLVTHNINSLLSRILKSKNPAINLGHIYYYNPEILKRILIECGFSKIKVNNLKNIYKLNYCIEIFPFPRAIKIILQKILSYLNINEKKIKIKAGNLITYARK